MPNFPGVGVLGGVGSIPMLAARALQVQQAQAQAQAQVQAQAQAQALVQEAQMTLARRELIQREMVSRLVNLQNMRANQNPILNPELLKRTLGRVQLPLPTVPIQAQSGTHSFASPTPNPVGTVPSGSTGSPGQTSNVTNSIQEVDEVKSIHSDKSSPTPDVTSTVASVTNSVTNSGTIPSLAGLGNSLGNSPLGNFQLGTDSSNIQKLLLQKISQSQSELNKDKLSGKKYVFYLKNINFKNI